MSSTAASSQQCSLAHCIALSATVWHKHSHFLLICGVTLGWFHLKLAHLYPNCVGSLTHPQDVLRTLFALLQDEFGYDRTDGHAVLERPPNSPVAPKRVMSDIISFKRVALDAPDGMPLVRQPRHIALLRSCSHLGCMVREMSAPVRVLCGILEDSSSLECLHVACLEVVPQLP